MPSIFDKLFEGRRSLTAAEYGIQSEKVNTFVMDHKQYLENFLKTIEKNENVFKVDKALYLKQISFATSILNQIKPHIFTEKERHDLRKGLFTNNDVEKEQQAYFYAIKVLDKKLMAFSEIYARLAENITKKLKSIKPEEKPKLPLVAFDKERKEKKEDNREQILKRLKAQGAKATEMNLTNPRQRR